MADNEPPVLLTAELDCPSGASAWHYIAPSDVDRHWVALAFAELEDAHDDCDLLCIQTQFIAPGQELPQAGRWQCGPYAPLTTDPTFAQRARLAD